MYQCQKCKKQVVTCPACKYRIKDPKAALINQIAGVLVVLTIIFVSLEIKVKEETEIAMKPFRQAQEETAKKEKVKEAGLPKPAKPDKSSGKNKKKSNKAGGSGKEGDFRVGTWGMLRSEIIETEKAQKIICSPRIVLPGVVTYLRASNCLNWKKFVKTTKSKLVKPAQPG
jgi:hypothetical protein